MPKKKASKKQSSKKVSQKVDLNAARNKLITKYEKTYLKYEKTGKHSDLVKALIYMEAAKALPIYR